MTSPPALPPLRPDDYWEMRLITDMRLAPDGRGIAYTLETSDRAANEARSAIWLLDTANGASRQLTSGAKRDSAPRWSPDGTRLAFLSTRDGREAQLFVLPVAGGGEPHQLTAFQRGVSDLFWSPDGAWIGFKATLLPGASAPLAEIGDPTARARFERDEAEWPRHIERLIYRWDGKGYLAGRTHLYRVAVAGGAIEPLTAGDYDDDSDGDYDDGEAACSPDGRFLAFLSDRTAQRDENMTSDLWLLDIERGATRRLTDERSAIARVAWSPDSARLAYVATPGVGAHSASNATLRIVDVASGQTTVCGAELDRAAEVALGTDVPAPSVSAPVWSADGRWIMLLAQDGGAVRVLRAAADGGAVEALALAPQAHIRQIALAPVPAGDELYTLQCDPLAGWDVWRWPLRESAAEPSEGQRLTTHGTEPFAGRARATPERIHYASFDEQWIEGWLYRPPAGRAAGAQAPLVLLIHGGPHGAYGSSLSLLTQALAGMGYAVLQLNPRGSAGYGEAFLRACDRDWGGGDFRDLMAGVDAALARGGLDTARLAVCGVSYGGYMTNWVITQTDRFRAAVSIYGIGNLWGMFGTADMDRVWAQGDYGWPWERGDFYTARSPISHAASVTTPLRIIAASDDYRCPREQSEEWYTWLKHRGRAPVDLIELPRASHASFASPRQRIQRLELTLEWIARYCPVSAT